MKFFIDSADLKELRELAATGLVDGVTTNPSLIAKSGRNMLEVIAENGGDLDVELPRDLAVRWADGVRLLGADALAGMEWRRDAECSVRFARFVGLGDARLRPGERRMLGWIRLSGGMEVTVDVVE